MALEAQPNIVAVALITLSALGWIAPSMQLAFNGANQRIKLGRLHEIILIVGNGSALGLRQGAIELA